MPIVGFDPSTVNDVSPTDFTVGEIYTFGGKTYRYLQNAADNATANGDVCVMTATPNVFTPCHTGSGLGTGGTNSALTNDGPMGVAVGTISPSRYGFLQIRGVHTAVKCAAGAAGDTLMPTAATLGDAVIGTGSIINLSKKIGRALTAAAAGIITVEVNI